MSLEIDAISNIVLRKEDWRLKVRVVRLWKVPLFKNAEITGSIELVLMDQFGSKIHATVRKTLVQKYLTLLKEGLTYVMCFFSVGNNSGGFRTTRHEFKLFFQFRSTVTPCTAEMIPQYGLSLVPLSEILSTGGECDYLADVIGLLTGVSSEKEYEKEGSVTKMVVIQITSDGKQVECALFGEYVDLVSQFLSSGNKEAAVVVLQFVKIKLFKGKVVLQNVMNGTRVLFNPEIAEVVSFRQSLSAAEITGCQSVSVISDGSNLSLEDEFMKMYPKRSVVELITGREAGSCIIFGGVVEVMKEEKWFYMACKCNKAVKADGDDIFFCSTCATVSTNLTPRFLLKVRVADEEGSVVLLLFDRDVNTLLKKTAVDLVTELKKAGGAVESPVCFGELVGKKLLFRVEMKSGPMGFADECYRVKRVCDDESIMSMYSLALLNGGIEKDVLDITPAVKEGAAADGGSVNVEGMFSESAGGPAVLGRESGLLDDTVVVAPKRATRSALQVGNVADEIAAKKQRNGNVKGKGKAINVQ